MLYTYDPTQIRKRGKDQMRFEVGDTLIEGGAETCVLADEEYEAIIADIKEGKKAWLFAKLAVLEAILFKLSYAVNTKIDVLTYNFGDRAAQWKTLYDQIKAQILATMSVPIMDASAEKKPPYFHTGMEENYRAKGNYAPYSPFRKMTE